jgi:hypothetical protein
LITTVSCDAAGTTCPLANRITSDVTVDNTISIGAPVANATVSGNVPIVANVAGGGVRFDVDSKKVAFDNSAPFSTTWSTAGVPDGAHTVPSRPAM